MFKDFDDFSFKDLFDAKPKYKKLKLKEGERRQVSVLFADLSGFTSLSEKLDSEELQTISDEILQIFTKCIEHYGGDIDKYEGDLVMAHFGAIKASERDTERAISSAFLMLEQLAKFNRKLQQYLKTKNIELKVRIGINTGEVTTGKVGKKRQYDFTVYGTVVNVASRMESNAPLNRIMITAETKELVKDIFEFEDFGEISVKGISHPVSVFLVKERKKERKQRWEFWQSKLVGREKELNILEKKFQEVQKRNVKDVDKKPILLGINGDPGIGKSRLVYEFLKKHPDFILEGTTPKTYQIHFALFTSLLSKYFGIFKSDSTENKKAKLEKGYEEIISILKEENDIEDLRNSLPLIGLLFHIQYDDPRLQLEGKELLPHIQTAIRHFIEAKAGEAQQNNSNLILVLEDLHWLDEISKNTTNFLIETLNLEEKRAHKFYKNIFVIFIYRPEYEIPQIIIKKTEFTEIELEPLNEKDSNRIIKSMTKDIEIPETTFEKVREMSSGNPFYLEEWCNLVNDLNGKRDKLPIPNTLNALILARIDRLEKDMKQLLQNTAVIGKEFMTKILSEVENRLETSTNVDDFLQELETNEYLRRILGVKYSKYFFKHILTHEVAYRTILRSNRRLLHKLVAEVIEEQFSDNLESFYFELAHHFSKAELKDKAIEYLEKAGDEAKKNYDNLKAIEMYDQCIAFIEKSENLQGFENLEGLKINILLKKTEILVSVGRFKEAEELASHLLKESKQIDNQKYACLTLKHLSHINLIKNNLDEAFKLLQKREEAATKLDDHQEIASIYGNFGVYYLLKKDYNNALKYHQKSLRLAEKNQVMKDVVSANTNLGSTYLEISDYDNSLKYSKLAYEEAQKNGYKINELTAINNLGVVYQKKGELNKALQCYEDSLHSAEGILNKQKIALALGNIGNIYRDKKEYDKALEYYQKAYAVKKEMGLKKGMAISLKVISDIFINKKKYSKAITYIDQAITLTDKWVVDHCAYKLHKANILFLQEKIKEAEALNNEVLRIAKSLDHEVLMSDSKDLKEKIKSFTNKAKS